MFFSRASLLVGVIAFIFGYFLFPVCLDFFPLFIASSEPSRVVSEKLMYIS